MTLRRETWEGGNVKILDEPLTELRASVRKKRRIDEKPGARTSVSVSNKETEPCGRQSVVDC
jgi:hypothetical protein